MGNCSSADRRGSFMRKRGHSFKTRDEDTCAYGTHSSLDKDEEEEREKLMRTEDQAADKGVVPSDSGIESLGPSTDESQDDTCKKCNHRYQKQSQTSCQHCGQTQLKCSPSKSEPDTYCSCGPRNALLHTWQKNLICKTHPHSPKFYRHSDVIEVKPSSKRGRRRIPERRSQFSCKSSDSLDYAGAMMTSMDNAQSVVSEIFGDDVSLRAPLAAFDSVDCQLDSEDASRRERTLSQIEDLTIRICQCGVHSNRPSETGQTDKDNQDNNDQHSRISPERSESCINGFTEDVLRSSFSKKDMARPLFLSRDAQKNGDISRSQVYARNGKEELSASLTTVSLKDRISRPNSFRHSMSESEDSFVLSGVTLPQDVTVSMVNGQEMVMMNMSAYCQLLDELHLLKSQLARLSSVLQDNDDNLSDEVD
ncbi:uncharacterized protein LOC124132589 [Haliotis rufescens]|uniref:uncharacterized protein LOC124132589 n=1 Tax=Haliotis rufescens TaxID=6454 RepID=UPI00201F455B|nr:uncharacterized protein LOC124132589 [Haliotis rufescens]XP_046352523.2 uncharacterized protein LOC124132589 [Haliotis rufescens]XP_048248479.1 uncharacterized protein LOC124132589 [Haliotis rufescens]